jgi:hypothetical protein
MIGAGVTAFDMEDAKALLVRDVFIARPIPPIVKVVEDVDPSTLDPWFVLANMHPPTDRGVWFPAMRGQPAGRGLVARVHELLGYRGEVSRHRGVSGDRR